jgi:hypothetical protein
LDQVWHSQDSPINLQIFGVVKFEFLGKLCGSVLAAFAVRGFF